MYERLYRITVRRVAGAFPIDMLRCDHCWPDQPDDTKSIERCLRKSKASDDQVHLISQKLPCMDRWAAAGWPVVRREERDDYHWRELPSDTA